MMSTVTHIVSAHSFALTKGSKELRHFPTNVGENAKFIVAIIILTR